MAVEQLCVSLCGQCHCLSVCMSVCVCGQCHRHCLCLCVWSVSLSVSVCVVNVIVCLCGQCHLLCRWWMRQQEMMMKHHWSVRCSCRIYILVTSLTQTLLHTWNISHTPTSARWWVCQLSTNHWVAWSVCLSVCLLVTFIFISSPKTFEPIKIPIGGYKEPFIAWGPDSSRQNGKFWGFFGPLESYCCSICSKKSITALARLLQPTALLQNGWCHINFSPVINPPPVMRSLVKIVWRLVAICYCNWLYTM